MIKFETINTKVFFSNIKINEYYCSGNCTLTLNDSHNNDVACAYCDFIVKDLNDDYMTIGHANYIIGEFNSSGNETLIIEINRDDLIDIDTAKEILYEVMSEVREKYLDKVFSGDIASINDDVVEDSSIGE